MDQAKIKRVIELMMFLTKNRYSTISDIAKKFETSTRTIYRYLDTFKEAGFVVKKVSGNVYKIDKSSPQFKDISQLIHFTEEEAHILKSAIESIAETNLLKQNLKKKLYSVYDFKFLADVVVEPKNQDNVQALCTAMEEKRIVKLKGYQSAHSDTVSDRTVEPFEFTSNYIQIWCYEQESKTNKIFKVERIGEVEILDQTWENTAKHKSEALDIFRIHSAHQYPIKLRLTVRAASLLKEEYPLASKYLIQDTQNSWILDTFVSNYEGVGRFVLGLFSDVEIIESDEFKKFIKKKIELMAKHFSL